MKKIFAIFFAFFALGAATAAKADSPLAPFVRGTYCSADTTDGNWAFAFNLNDVFSNCNLVRNVLAAGTFSPIERSTRGYYWADALNAVYIDCWGGTAWFRGLGIQPLQNAFNYANRYNGRGCIFQVN